MLSLNFYSGKISLYLEEEVFDDDGMLSFILLFLHKIKIEKKYEFWDIIFIKMFGFNNLIYLSSTIVL